jgi:hypothetical protein
MALWWKLIQNIVSMRNIFVANYVKAYSNIAKKQFYTIHWLILIASVFAVIYIIIINFVLDVGKLDAIAASIIITTVHLFVSFVQQILIIYFNLTRIQSSRKSKPFPWIDNWNSFWHLYWINTKTDVLVVSKVCPERFSPPFKYPS